MSQSRLASLLEANANTFIGYWISVAVGQFVYPLFGFDVNIQDNMAMTAIFVAVSFTRSYITRRIFNWHTLRRSKHVRP